MLVSIITVCYNSENTIERTIQSVVNQRDSDIEYIIIDGQSTDNTLSIIQRYQSVLGDRLRVISEPDGGIYYAMNKGLAMAKGEIIGIINSDDWYLNDAIKAVTDTYSSLLEKDFTVLYGGMCCYSEGIISEVYYSDASLLEEKMIDHPSCFVTRDCYSKFGYFDTRYKYVADYDFMLRLYKTGMVRFQRIEKPLSVFTVGGASSTMKAAWELYDLRMAYGLMRYQEVLVLKIKDRLSSAFAMVYSYVRRTK